jgi:alpha-N-arabinofuranosidase
MPLVLYRQHFGTIPVAVEHKATPLDVSAALTPDKKALTVAVVNPTKEAAQLKLNLGSLKLAGPAQTWVIAGDDPLAFNQPGESRKVDIKEDRATDLAGVVSVRPLSITLWKVTIQ